jgi:tRNA pseudouridine55 synthase
MEEAGLNMLHGWIILDKPLALGSTQAVAAVKRNLRDAGYKVSGKGGGVTKIGHGGTLDPLATGVLPIAVGEATKLTGRMLEASKVYDFTIAFGSQTTTLDAEGEVMATSDHRPNLTDIEAILPQFTGPIEQVPPAFSALKVDGKRAYALARAGEEVELKARQVTIHNLVTNKVVQAQNDIIEAITLTANVSKGTYIRSLARDIALALGTVGYVTMLRRTKAGPFSLNHAISLDNLNEVGKGAAIDNFILPFAAGLDGIPALPLNPEQARQVQQGQKISGFAMDDGQYYAQGGNQNPLALIELCEGELRIIRGFNF